jgi:uncharacterized protein (DUF169 family)
MDYLQIEKQLTSELSLTHRPVAVASLPHAPAGVEQFEGVQPSGCSYWALASAGRAFYTVAADHYNCSIGSHTHNIPLPEDRAHELSDTLGFMNSIGYLRMEEVPSIPQLAETPGVVIYAPLGDTPVDPDVVLFWGPPGKVMLLQEAALRAGVAAQLNTLGRPTCMVVPAALTHGVLASTGCVGNRVYTGMNESELYVAVPGRDLQRIADETATIASANTTLQQYHEDRKRQLTPA